MRKKLTLEDCQRIAAERGGKCLSTEYTKSHDNMQWQCQQQHSWTASLHSVKDSKTWCAVCAGVAKLSLDDCHKIAAKRGGTCLSTKYESNRGKLEWLCADGHTWFASYNDISSANHWCQRCAGNLKGTLEECQILAKSRKGKCLSEVYLNNRTDMKWECELGHIWDTPFDGIKYYKTWCPECSGNKKYTLEYCMRIAAAKGGKCLSKKYDGKDAPLLWECSCGYRWETSLHSLTSMKSWCPSCAGCAKHTIDECKKVAEARNGKCLSSEYSGLRDKLRWECSCGYQWEANFSGVLHGQTWCPKCALLKTQKTIFDIVKESVCGPIYCDSKPFKWLINHDTRSRLQIDIWCPGLKLAIEYDGGQHFIPVRFGNISKEKATKNLEMCQARDAIKDKLIAEHPEEVEYFIRFSYKEKITKEFVLGKLKQAGVPL